MDIKEGELIMGVGNGSGNLFVKGDYDSITVLQQKLFELEDLRNNVEYLELRKRLSELEEEVKEKNTEITRLRLELASEKGNSYIKKNNFKPWNQPEKCYPNVPKYPGQDIIWCSGAASRGQYFS